MKKVTLLMISCIAVILLMACANHEGEPQTVTQEVVESSVGETIMVTEMVSEKQEEKEEKMAETMVEIGPGVELEPIQKESMMQIKILANGNETIFELNDSSAAKALYDQLPLTIAVENYSTNEKIFYPPTKLDTSDTPLAEASVGTLAYFAPWGNVVMFYDNTDTIGSLYILGHAITGSEHIQTMDGTIQIEK